MPIKVKKREYFYNGNIMCFPLLEIRHAGILWRFSQLFMFSKSENLFTFFIIDNEKFPVAKRIFFKDLIRWKDLFLCQVENNRFVFLLYMILCLFIVLWKATFVMVSKLPC